MWPFLSHIATLGVVLFLWKRVEPSFLRILKRWEPVESEYAPPVSAPQYAEPVAQHEVEQVSDPMPVELYEAAMRESESWAREQTIAAMHQLKDRVKSWDRVLAIYNKDVS